MKRTEVFINCSLMWLYPLILDSQGFGQGLGEMGSGSGWVPERLTQSMLLEIGERVQREKSMRQTSTWARLAS